MLNWVPYSVLLEEWRCNSEKMINYLLVLYDVVLYR
jgi:hypothetical protein